VDVIELPPGCPRWVRLESDPSQVGRVLLRHDGWYQVLLSDGTESPWMARKTEPCEPPKPSLEPTPTAALLADYDAAFDAALAEASKR
jgi:hypothetical protein